MELCGHPMMDALAPHKTNTTYTNTTNAYATNTLKLCGHPIRDAQPQKPNTTMVHKGGGQIIKMEI